MAKAKNEKLSDDQYQQAYEQALHMFSHRQTITGIDVGTKYSNGQRTDTKAIRLHVQEKFAPEVLAAAEVFPEEIAGVPTDVIQAVYNPGRVMNDLRVRRQRLDPIQPGISVGHLNITAGTFGTIVYDENSGQPCILSNWHVLAGSADAVPGDPIVQPGKADGGRAPRDTIATLERSVLGADGDAAIALLNGTRAVRDTQFSTDALIRSARMVVEEEVLEKSGRTTGNTRGKVDGVGRYFLDYSVGRVGIDGFKLVPELEGNPNNDEISSGGDSGSVWYDPVTHEGVGLHFAGEISPNPLAENALACHLPRVLAALDVSLSPPQVVTPLAPTMPIVLPQQHDDTPTNHDVMVATGNGNQEYDINIHIHIRPNQRPATDPVPTTQT